MLNDHPLVFLPTQSRQKLFWLFTLLSFVCYVVFMFLDQPARTSAAPSGIVSFELAGTVENVRAMLASWGGEAMLNVSFGLGFDFLFMPFYSIALSLGILLASNRRPGKTWARFGNLIGWGVFAAVIFDATENISLFALLSGQTATFLPPLAAGCASIKFGLLIIGTLYGLGGWLFPHKP